MEIKWESIRDCVGITAMVAIGPTVLKMCHWPIELHHQIGFGLVGLAATTYVLANRSEEPTDTADIIDAVFERGNVGIKLDKDTMLRPLRIFEHRED